MSDSRGWHASVPKQTCGYILGKEARILRGIVEHDFAQTKELSARHKLIELHGEARPIVQRAEASASLESHRHIPIDLLADDNRGADVSVVVAFEFLELRFGNVDLES